MACGWNIYEECNIPALAEGVTYTHVSAGTQHTVLLRSDGVAVACGSNRAGQCDLPALGDGLIYAADLLPTLLLQASLDGDSVRFLTFGGAERCQIGAMPTARLGSIREQLAAEHRAGRLGTGLARVNAVLPDSSLANEAVAEETVASAFGP